MPELASALYCVHEFCTTSVPQGMSMSMCCTNQRGSERRENTQSYPPQIASSMVVHILGKAVKGKYKISFGLAKTFYGVGLQTATRICSKLGFYPDMRMHQLSEQQTMSITKELSEMTTDSKLLSQVRANIRMKREIGSYVGMRHSMGLPVRGQRTKTNAKTARKLNRIERKM